MGWETREWARWTPHERARFYGGGFSTGAAPATRARTRWIVWGGVAMATVATFTFALAQKASAPLPTGPVPSSFPSPAAPFAPHGSKMVCTTRELDTRTGAWRCTRITLVPLPDGTRLQAPSGATA